MLSKAIAKFHLKPISGPEVFVIIVSLVFGVFYCLATPLGAGYDEDTHLYRVWEMSKLHFLPNEKLGSEMWFPTIYRELSYRQNLIIRPIEPGFWTKYGKDPIDVHDYIYERRLKTRSIYPPNLLLPQAMVMRYFGHAWDLPALVVYYAMRMAGLLFYLLLAWLAVRFIPFGKWTLAILAVAPMAIYQASTINVDAISNGLGLLFIGGSLAISMRKEIDRNAWIELLILFVLLFSSKVNQAPLALLPFLLIPPSKFKKRGYILLSIAALTLFLVEMVGWNLIAYSRSSSHIENVDIVAQIDHIIKHPLAFLQTILFDLRDKTPTYLMGWIGVYGYGYWIVPKITYIIFPIALILSLLIRQEECTPNRRTRAILAAFFIASYLGTLVILYLSATPVGLGEIRGIQGRYFFAIAPLLFLAITNPPILSRVHIPIKLSTAFSIVSLAFYSIGLYLSYHIVCGVNYYERGLCMQPVYKNWAPEALYSPRLSNQMGLSQEMLVECNGLTQVKVWLDSTGADTEGSTKFSFIDLKSNQTIAEQTYFNKNIPERGALALDFPPIWDSSEKNYRLEIQTAPGSTGNGIRVSYSLKPEYFEGQMREGDRVMDQDLAFQYGCLTGLEKILQE